MSSLYLLLAAWVYLCASLGPMASLGLGGLTYPRMQRPLGSSWLRLLTSDAFLGDDSEQI